MSNKDLVTELKAHIKDLIQEKDDLNKSLHLKDSRIKQLLLKLEDANNEVKATVKRMSESREETVEALNEVEMMNKKIKSIRHNLGLGQEINREFLGDNDQSSEKNQD